MRFASEFWRDNQKSFTNKNVTLRKVENGYTVSTWDDKKSKDLVYIAKDLDDAQEIMNEILN